MSFRALVDPSALVKMRAHPHARIYASGLRMSLRSMAAPARHTPRSPRRYRLPPRCRPGQTAPGRRRNRCPPRRRTVRRRHPDRSRIRRCSQGGLQFWTCSSMVGQRRHMARRCRARRVPQNKTVAARRRCPSPWGIGRGRRCLLWNRSTAAAVRHRPRLLPIDTCVHFVYV